MQVIEGCDIDRDLTLREVIDDLVDKTNWLKYESMFVELDEPEFIVKIIVEKKEGPHGKDTGPKAS